MSADKPDPDQDKGNDQGFLARWSRLKQDEDRTRSAARTPAARTASRDTAKPDVEAPPLDLTKLPKLDDLTGESDIAAFLQKGVPEDLRRLALRKAWTLDPKIRDFVEMAENQYDWNKPDGVPGFGPLPADVDMKTLLAQAIGEWPGPAETADAAESAAAPRAIATPEVASGADAIAAGATPAAVEPANKSSERLTLAAPKAAGADAPDSAAPSSRRRHGGALPRPTET